MNRGKLAICSLPERRRRQPPRRSAETCHESRAEAERRSPRSTASRRTLVGERRDQLAARAGACGVRRRQDGAAASRRRRLRRRSTSPTSKRRRAGAAAPSCAASAPRTLRARAASARSPRSSSEQCDDQRVAGHAAPAATCRATCSPTASRPDRPAASTSGSTAGTPAEPADDRRRSGAGRSRRASPARRDTADTAAARSPRSAASVVVTIACWNPATASSSSTAPLGVELAGDVVQQEQRLLVALLGEQVGLGQEQRQERAPLLALRAEQAQVAVAVDQAEVVQVRPGAGGRAVDVAAAPLGQRRGDRPSPARAVAAVAQRGRAGSPPSCSSRSANGPARRVTEARRGRRRARPRLRRATSSQGSSAVLAPPRRLGPGAAGGFAAPARGRTRRRCGGSRGPQPRHARGRSRRGGAPAAPAPARSRSGVNTSTGKRGQQAVDRPLGGAVDA